MKKRKKIDFSPMNAPAVSRHHLAEVLIIIFFIAVAYSVSFRNSFQFDDIPRIIQNQNLRNLSSLKSEYPFLHGKRAVVNYSLWLNSLTGGQISPAETQTAENTPALSIENFKAWQYHAFNIFIHCANGILLYFLILKILAISQYVQDDLKRRFVALGATLLFALHPIQTQSVTYIIQRAELLAGFFQFTALLLYIEGRTRQGTGQKILLFAGTIVCYALALESKEQSAIFPLLIILFELFILKSSRKSRLPFIVATMAVMLLVTTVFLHNLANTYRGDTAAGFDIKGISKGHYALTNLRVLFTYLRLLILPINQNLDYDYPISTSLIDPPTTLLAFIALLGIITFAIAIAKKYPLHSFCIFFFLITLAPSSSFIPIVDVIFEHRLYLPCFGFFLLIALFVERLYGFMEQKNIVRRKAITGAIFSIIIISCVVGTIRRNLVWRTPITLWQDVVVKSPNKARGYMNLGHEQFRLFRKTSQTHKTNQYLNDALANFEKSIELDPKQLDAYTNLSLVYLELDRGEEAIEAIKKAVKLDPENPEMYLKLADMYYRLARHKEAAEYFDSILTKDYVLKQRFKADNKFRNAFAKLYLAYGMSLEFNDSGERYGEGFPVAETIEAYRISLEWMPLTDTYYSLAVVYDRTGDLQGALINYRKVIEINPDYQFAGIIINRIKDIESQN